MVTPVSVAASIVSVLNNKAVCTVQPQRPSKHLQRGAIRAEGSEHWPPHGEPPNTTRIARTWEGERLANMR
jgi:hypothetical protein